MCVGKIVSVSCSGELAGSAKGESLPANTLKEKSQLIRHLTFQPSVSTGVRKKIKTDIQKPDFYI